MCCVKHSVEYAIEDNIATIAVACGGLGFVTDGSDGERESGAEVLISTGMVVSV